MSLWKFFGGHVIYWILQKIYPDRQKIIYLRHGSKRCAKTLQYILSISDLDWLCTSGTSLHWQQINQGIKFLASGYVNGTPH